MDLNSKIEVTIGPYEVISCPTENHRIAMGSILSDSYLLDYHRICDMYLPVQVYEDTLAAQKAAFESFVTITDPVESEKLSLYKSLLPEMEQVYIFCCF